MWPCSPRLPSGSGACSVIASSPVYRPPSSHGMMETELAVLVRGLRHEATTGEANQSQQHGREITSVAKKEEAV